jgi:protein O-GlcNAc transferase
VVGVFYIMFSMKNRRKQKKVNLAVVSALINSGANFFSSNQIDRAENKFREAIKFAPNVPEAWNNLGSVLKEQGRLLEAHKCFKKAIMLRPEYASAHSNLLFVSHYLPHQTLCKNKRAHQKWVLKHLKKTTVNSALKSFDGCRRIKVGLVSPDLYFHPVGVFILPWLLNRSHKFEMYVYHGNQRVDPLTQQIKNNVDHWRNCVGMIDKDLAGVINKDEIDILIDLSGHTAGNRLPLFAQRQAKVQVSWIGYPSTTGVKEMDYVFMDHFSAPEGYQVGFTEKLVRLEGLRFCYSPPSYAPPVVQSPVIRNGYVTFGSYNNLAKLTSDVIKVWAKILEVVRNSRLILKWKSLSDEVTKSRIVDQFVKYGIEKERIECRGWSSHSEMLVEYGDIDVALDPFPFSGGLTSCDALYMGVPTITLAGELPIGRQTGSFLDALKLNELIAYTGVCQRSCVCRSNADRSAGS